MTTHKAIREALPELPAPDRTMWQHGQQIDHYTADQMRAYALQAVEALRREPMTDEQIRSLCKEEWVFETVKQWVRIAEAHHHIAQKEQSK